MSGNIQNLVTVGLNYNNYCKYIQCVICTHTPLAQNIKKIYVRWLETYVKTICFVLFDFWNINVAIIGKFYMIGLEHKFEWTNDSLAYFSIFFKFLEKKFKDILGDFPSRPILEAGRFFSLANFRAWKKNSNFFWTWHQFWKITYLKIVENGQATAIFIKKSWPNLEI